jgi:hypothetical protein
LAVSASANAASPSGSPSLGRVRVSAQERHSGPSLPGSSAQLHFASSKFAHLRTPAASVPSIIATTSRREGTKASGVEQRRQRLFSKNRSWPQLSQVNARKAS